MRQKSDRKHNLVIHSKKLPHSVENERKEWHASKEGKARKAEAQAHQKSFQGSIDDAMRQKKLETGSTGMSNDEMNDLIGDIGEKNSARTAFGMAGKRPPCTAKTFKYVKGKGVVQVAGPRD